jgi:predicted dehydrogenase
MTEKSISRRRFLGSAGAAAGLMIVPRHVIAASGEKPPSEKLAIACIGIGGRGRASVDAARGENIVAFCDVDDRRAGNLYEKFPDVKRYRDFRKLLAEVGDKIDAVTVGTPDHTHAVAAIAAIRLGKHVYCEKPLAHSIAEIRALQKAAREKKVITQLGNQGHSFETIRRFREWIEDGAVGNVHTIHAACDANHCRIAQLPRMSEEHEIPPELDWSLWLGPAKMRPYNPMYLPGSWRAWSAFGSGTIGDWVCHVVDPSFWALDLGYPKSVEAEEKDYDPKLHFETFPRASRIRFEFAAKGKRGPVTLFWYNGEWPMPAQDGLPEDRVPKTGAIILGDQGGIVHGSHGAGGVRLFPNEKMKAYKQPAPSIPRVRNNDHYNDWLDSIRAGKPAGSNFEYGGPLTELARLGTIAEYFPGTKLEWNGEKGEFTNNADANKYLNPPYREGWSL